MTSHPRPIPACNPQWRAKTEGLLMPITKLIRTLLLGILPILFIGFTQAESPKGDVNVNVSVEVNVNIPQSDGRSSEGTRRARIYFWNLTGEVVNIYWVDFAGNRRLKSTLKPSHVYNLRTYEGRVWVVTDMQGNKLSHVVAEARNHQTVHIKKLAIASHDQATTSVD